VAHNWCVATAATFLESDCVGITIDGRFPLLRWLGGTEESSVFLTEADGGRKAAIKIILANTAEAEIRLAQWEMAGTLSHPHLIHVFGCGRSEVDGVDVLYVVTEYADEVLSEILGERALNAAETREMLRQVMEALVWLHERNLVHGHLKPSNILVVDDRIKLSSDRLQMAGAAGWVSSSSGKYDAPEATALTIAPAADVWSLGMVLCETLTRRLPRWEGRGDPVVPAPPAPPFFGIARECIRVDLERRISLGDIREILEPAPAVRPRRRIAATRTPRVRRARMPGDRVPWASKAKTMTLAAVLVAVWIVTMLVADSHLRPLLAAGPAHSDLTAQSQAQAKTQAPTQAETPAQTRVLTPAQASVPETRPPISETRPSVPATQARVAAQAEQGPVVKGVVGDQAMPDIPQHILDGVQGHFGVRVAVEVDAEGKVIEASLDSPGPSQYFANKALTAARGWKFTPAETGGLAVASQWMLTFRFGEDGAAVTAAETAP
jgi:TonB family protein